MENASKALIIAGAILLSILIIALGVYVFNMAKGSVNTNSLDSVELSTFNDPITNYEGKQMGSSVKKLLSDLISNTATNAGSADRLPDIYYYDEEGNGPTIANNLSTIKSTVDEPKSSEMSQLRNKIADSHYYEVRFGYNSAGLVACVHISYGAGNDCTHTDDDWQQ